MYRTDAVDNIAIIPASTATGTVGYYQAGGAGVGTVVDGEHLNAIQEELIAILVAFSVTPNKAILDQIALEFTARIMAIVSSATDTTSVSTDQTRTVIASTTSQASGAASAVIASVDGLASGGGSACVATTGATTDASGVGSLVAASDDSIASGNQVAILASMDTSVTNGISNGLSAAIGSRDVTNAGIQAVALAARDATIGLTSSHSLTAAVLAQAAGDVDMDGDQSAIIASEGHTATPTSIDSTTVQGAILACEDVVMTGAANAAVIASDGVIMTGTESACVACGTITGGGIDVGGTSSAAIGITGGIHVDGSNSVCLASDFDTDAGAVTETETVFGGDGNAVTWRIKSTTGQADFEKLRVNDGALIGGAAGPPTLAANVANVGIGPQNNAQAQWLEVNIAGTLHWIPVWT